MEFSEEERIDVEDSNNGNLQDIEQRERVHSVQNRFTYRNLTITADRYRVSSRAAASIVNAAALKDMEMLNPKW